MNRAPPLPLFRHNHRVTKIEGTPESAAAEAGAWRCEVCGSTLGGKTRRGRPRRYCSRACQQTAYRQRREPGEVERQVEVWEALTAIGADLRDGRLAAVARELTGDRLRVAYREATVAVEAVRALVELAGPVEIVSMADTGVFMSTLCHPFVEPVLVESAPPVSVSPVVEAAAVVSHGEAKEGEAGAAPSLPAPVEVPAGADARRRRAVEVWNGLNGRQRLYLEAIHDADRVAESNARGDALDWGPRPSAETWRWLLYTVEGGEQVSGLTPIQWKVRRRGHHDPGAGSTLAALVTRGLVERRDGFVRTLLRGMTPCVHVRLTPAGRAAARAGRGESGPVSVPRGLTSEWVWSTLTRFYVADLAGGFTGREPSWNACLQLRNRRGGSFIEEGPLRISALGREHYENHWACYRELHPGVDAPEPAHRPAGAHAGLVDHKAPPRPRGLLNRSSWRALDHLVACHRAGESHLRHHLHGTHRDRARPAEIADLPHGSSRAALTRHSRSKTAVDHLLDHRGVALAAEREVTHLNGHVLDAGKRLWIVWPTDAGLTHHAEHADTYRALYTD